MAKRKRLSPTAIVPGAPDLETKSGSGWVGYGVRRPPIADVSGEAAQIAAFEEVAEELHQARSEGRMVLRLPLSSVVPGHLVRDRADVDADDMEALKACLRDRGQQTPIEVVDLGSGQYGLISGWRRLMALQALSEEDQSTGAFGHVLALIRAPETAEEAYRAMVEENEIRDDISFYARASIAVKAAEQGVYPSTKAAVQSLFAAARAPKRSKIIAFTTLFEALDDHLRFPTAIPEKLGLPLASAVQDRPDFRDELIGSLRDAAASDAPTERGVLERMLKKKRVTTKAPLVEKVASGITLEAGKGRVTLAGKGVSAALLTDLRAWLRARDDSD